MILNWISESSNTEIANVPGGVLVFKTGPRSPRRRASLGAVRALRASPTAWSYSSPALLPSRPHFHSPSTTSGLVFIPDVVLVSRNKDYKLISLKDFEVDKYSGWEKA